MERKVVNVEKQDVDFPVSIFLCTFIATLREKVT
jgi:hypothetical protein